ncbi:hypothetical protein [Halopiger djelfimassiliensis]|uniref:hypothetical protein n=1 Tax=Halopiger djelfimassiliensis TaxID=1293047 RepID=UPI000677691D|nr:hypothetical protein [Halopiger djelfimassiliensis]
MSDLPRRRLLAGTGTVLTGAIAGCSSSDDDESDAEENDDEPDESGSDPATTDAGSDVTAAPGSGTLLGDISVENLHDDQHTVDVMVEVDGEIEHWTTHELEADSGTALERTWSTEPGSLRVLVRLDNGEPTQITPAKWNDPACLNVYAMVDRDGELTILGDTDDGPCSDGG